MLSVSFESAQVRRGHRPYNTRGRRHRRPTPSCIVRSRGRSRTALRSGSCAFGEDKIRIDQTVAALSVMAYSFVVTFIIAKVIDGKMGLRIEEVAERVGLDQSQHAESAYQA
ncbi:hypothetical protein OA084_01065 [Actinomycetota bacterium]|nr:hypothetical protein [Actinomycetota bacterium]